MGSLEVRLLGPFAVGGVWGNMPRDLHEWGVHTS